MATEVSTNTLQQASPTDTLQPPAALPPLDSGDRLTRSEFERRYDAMPHLKKAELIEGVVYMPSPVRVRSHGKPHGQIMSWVGVYCAATPGVDFADNPTLRLDPEPYVKSSKQRQEYKRYKQKRCVCSALVCRN
jgi:hypothetical protein